MDRLSGALCRGARQVLEARLVGQDRGTGCWRIHRIRRRGGPRSARPGDHHRHAALRQRLRRRHVEEKPGPRDPGVGRDRSVQGNGSRGRQACRRRSRNAGIPHPPDHAALCGRRAPVLSAMGDHRGARCHANDRRRYHRHGRRHAGRAPRRPASRSRSR